MTDVHVIERVSDPNAVWERIKSESPDGGIVLDVSAGRIGAVSRLDPRSLTGSGGFQWIKAADYESLLAEKTRHDYVKLTHDIGSATISEDRSLKDVLAYNDELSLWWLSETSEKHAINYPLRWCLYCFELINSLFAQGIVTTGLTWHIWARDPIVSSLYAQAISARGKVNIRQGAEAQARIEIPRKVSWLKSHIYLLFVVLRAYILGTTSKLYDRTRLSRKRDSSREDVLVISISDTGWKQVADPEGHRSGIRSQDGYMGYMPWDISNDQTRISWIRNSITSHEYVAWKAKCQVNSGMNDASSYASLSLKSALRIIGSIGRIIIRYNRLVSANRAGPLWRYDRIVLDALIHRDLNLLVRRMAVNHMVRFEQYRKVAETIRPAAVLYKSEMFIPGRLITAAMKGRTRLIALQHGIHIDEAVPYQFDSRDVEGDDHVRYCPMPDVFAAFGEYARDQFAEWGGYDVRRVVPIGGVRHDHLVRTLYVAADKRPHQKAQLRDRFGLPRAESVVLLCTQQRQDVGRWFELVLKGLDVAGMNSFVAIQLHHAHGGAEQVHDTAAQHAFTQYRIFESATYPLIAAADVVVTGPSTIVLESILLDTPAISIAASGAYENYPYQKQNLASTASTVSEIGAAFNELLGEGANRRGTSYRTRHLRRHLWNDDAGACDRLLALIHADDNPFRRQAQGSGEPQVNVNREIQPPQDAVLGAAGDRRAARIEVASMTMCQK